MSGRDETLADVINSAVAHAGKNLYTAIPAKVVKWDASRCQADCQILIKDFYEDEEGERKTNSVPIIPGVPVEFQGAGGFRVTCPIGDGSDGTEQTTGLLIFCHRSIDKWLSGSGKEVDPEFDHDHALTDAVFIPGLKPFGSPWQSVPADEMSIGSDSDGNGRIHFASDTIKLGDGASKEVARKGDGVGAGTLAFTFGAGSGAATLAIVYTPGDGGAPQSLPAGSGTITIGEKITGGSSHVKAVD